MAGEEDVELRDLVAQSLEAKGVLGKIRVSSMSGRAVGLKAGGLVRRVVASIYLTASAFHSRDTDLMYTLVAIAIATGGL